MITSAQRKYNHVTAPSSFFPPPDDASLGGLSIDSQARGKGGGGGHGHGHGHGPAPGDKRESTSTNGSFTPPVGRGWCRRQQVLHRTPEDLWFCSTKVFAWSFHSFIVSTFQSGPVEQDRETRQKVEKIYQAASPITLLPKEVPLAAPQQYPWNKQSHHPQHPTPPCPHPFSRLTSVKRRNRPTTHSMEAGCPMPC